MTRHAATMAYVSRSGDWPASWADGVRRIAAARRAPAVAGAILALLAVAELIARLALDPRSIGRLAAAGSVTRAASAGVGTHVAQTANAGVSTQTVVVLCVLCLFTTLPLVFLRPAAAAVAVSAASVLSLALFQMLTVAGAGALLIVLYRLGHSGLQHRGSQLLAVLLSGPFLVLALANPAGGEAWVLTVLLASLAPAAALAGIARRARSEAVVHSAARQVIAGTLLEHTARGERARIVRELHDVVAHHISMVAVQAETARLTTAGMPAAGAQRLSAIGDTARTALTEMRRLLGVLREDAKTDAADRRPQPGLRQLNDLLDAARDASAAGTRLIVRGPPATLDPGVELAAYRIVQEALTNSRRHAPGAAVDVELHYVDDALELRIRDNGPGPLDTPPAGGHGLLGMRERAAAVGGELRTGPAVGGGFLIEASLPGKGDTA
jgi:signal transduction histidine kinase